MRSQVFSRNAVVICYQLILRASVLRCVVVLFAFMSLLLDLLSLHRQWRRPIKRNVEAQRQTAPRLLKHTTVKTGLGLAS